MKLIDKAAVVEEIERRKKELIELSNNFANTWACGSLDNILSFLDTLEVKEVDLEKEFYDFLDTLIGKDNGHLSEDELFRIAKYFFELGLRSTITEKDCKLIWNIGDEISNIPEEEFFKELLRRYKAQKGE